MGNLRRIFTLALMLVCASCAIMGNDTKSTVSINSNPPGANVIIEGRNYGMTPMIVQLNVKDYDVSLIKEGYGAAQFRLEKIQGIEKGPDGGRCLADAIGSMFIITFYSAYYSDYCKTFKEQEYNVEIPYSASNYDVRKSVRHPSANNYRPASSNVNSSGEIYGNDVGNYGGNQGNEYMIKQGYGRSQRLPVF